MMEKMRNETCAQILESLIKVKEERERKRERSCHFKRSHSALLETHAGEKSQEVKKKKEEKKLCYREEEKKSWYLKKLKKTSR